MCGVKSAPICAPRPARRRLPGSEGTATCEIPKAGACFQLQRVLSRLQPAPTLYSMPPLNLTPPSRPAASFAFTLPFRPHCTYQPRWGPVVFPDDGMECVLLEDTSSTCVCGGVCRARARGGERIKKKEDVPLHALKSVSQIRRKAKDAPHAAEVGDGWRVEEEEVGEEEDAGGGEKRRLAAAGEAEGQTDDTGRIQ